MSEQEKVDRNAGRNETRRITISVTQDERDAILQRSRIRQFKQVACYALRLFAKGVLQPVAKRDRNRCRKLETPITVPADLLEVLAKRLGNIDDRDIPGVVVRLILALPPVRSEVARLPRRRKAILSDNGRRLAALIWIGQELEAIFGQSATDAVSGNDLAQLLETLSAIALSAERLAQGGAA